MTVTVPFKNPLRQYTNLSYSFSVPGGISSQQRAYCYISNQERRHGHNGCGSNHPRSRFYLSGPVTDILTRPHLTKNRARHKVLPSLRSHLRTTHPTMFTPAFAPKSATNRYPSFIPPLFVRGSDTSQDPSLVLGGPWGLSHNANRNVSYRIVSVYEKRQPPYGT